MDAPIPKPAKLQELDVEAFLLGSVKLDSSRLQEEFIRISSMVAYWNERYARGLRKHLMAELDRKRTEAKLYLENREKLPGSGNKGPTVDQINAAVMGSEEYLDVRQAEISAEVEAIRLRGVLDALRAKRDMLVSLGAQRVQEMKGDPMLRRDAHQQQQAGGNGSDAGFDYSAPPSRRT